MVKIKSIKRIPHLSYDTYYIRNNDISCGHIFEHIIVSRIMNYMRKNEGINGQTSQELIKIMIDENLNFYPDDIETLLAKPIQQEEFDKALMEIEQEQSMKNTAYSSLLNTIRDKKLDERTLALSDIKSWFEKEIKDSTIYYFSYNKGQEKYEEIMNYKRNFSLKNKIEVKKGIAKADGGNFSYVYITIPIARIRNSSQVYFLQKLINYIQNSLYTLRNKGPYYQVAFSLYHYENIELFIFISNSDLDLLLNKLKELEKIFDFNESIKYSEKKVYPYQEELAIIYRDSNFLKRNTPKASKEDVEFIEQIFKAIRVERIDEKFDKEKELVYLNGVSKSFSRKTILEDVTLHIYEGDIIGLLGLNGQGKTTLIRCLLNLIPVDRGKIDFRVNMNKELGVMLQEVAIPENVTVEELIELIRNFSPNSLPLDKVFELSSLHDKRYKLTQTLSGGEKRRLQFALAIANDPKFLVLDEPTVGMDFVSKENFWREMKKFTQERKRAILLVSHDLEEVEEVTNRIIILNNHQIQVDCDVRDLEDGVKRTFRKVVYDE